LLFLLYINDIVNASNIFDIVQFADDTCLYLKNKNKKILQQTMNTEIIKISDWLISNVLSLNVSKSNFLFFSPFKEEPPIKLEIMETPIEQKKGCQVLRNTHR